ncbi:hypothetical protein Q8A67_004809 [Cirrhinus molitorella]|uniref:C-type lectin domain-containing protein n=1 Tax=Cirrhinus molitorella TaxID=172907 RepID=A0AA88TV65_9TELE|nr:hypothetical protein Q8A67_004809 [Cirrhinus molitorella]
MHRNNTNLDQFIWSDEDLQTNFYQWKGNQPAAKDSGQNCVEVDGTGWADYGCDNDLRFFCYMTLERDNKTWEEAVEHCKDHYTDLASLTTTQQLQQVKSNLRDEMSLRGETSIWVGLRFVAGQWFWLNTEPVTNQLTVEEQTWIEQAVEEQTWPEQAVEEQTWLEQAAEEQTWLVQAVEEQTWLEQAVEQQT